MNNNFAKLYDIANFLFTIYPIENINIDDNFLQITNNNIFFEYDYINNNICICFNDNCYKYDTRKSLNDMKNTINFLSQKCNNFCIDIECTHKQFTPNLIKKYIINKLPNIHIDIEYNV